MQFTEKNYSWAEVLSQILLIPHFAKEHTHAYTAISSSGNLYEKLDVKVWKTGAYGCTTKSEPDMYKVQLALPNYY